MLSALCDRVAVGGGGALDQPDAQAGVHASETGSLGLRAGEATQLVEDVARREAMSLEVGRFGAWLE